MAPVVEPKLAHYRAHPVVKMVFISFLRWFKYMVDFNKFNLFKMKLAR